MTYEELKKQATKNLRPEVKDDAVADARLMAHRYNHFDEVLEALEKTQALYAALVSAHHLRGRSNSGVYEYELDARSDANVGVLARAEEVKE